MFKGFLSQPGAIGSTAVKANDGSIIFMYSGPKGKVFKKSLDSGRTFVDEWFVNIGETTANSNLVRLKDNRLMMTLKKKPLNEDAYKIGGADFTVVFSSDEGKTWSGEKKVNKNSGCYYLMNDRLLRLKSGRILIPLCYVPKKFASKNHFETAGYSGCYYSDDEGQNWTEGIWMKAENADGMLAEPMVIETENSKVIMYMRTTKGYLYYGISADGGESFNVEQPTELRSPNAPFTVKKDIHSGKFFAVWDNAFPSVIHQSPRSPICLAVSDDGLKWDFIMELDNNPEHNYGYPAIYFTKDEIIITYYYNQTQKFNKNINQLKLKIFNRSELTIRKYKNIPLF